MLIDVYDVKHKEQVLNDVNKITESERQLTCKFDQKRRVCSPQPKINLIGFSKDAFFNK